MMNRDLIAKRNVMILQETYLYLIGLSTKGRLRLMENQRLVRSLDRFNPSVIALVQLRTTAVISSLRMMYIRLPFLT